MASVNYTCLLFGFENMTPRYSRSQEKEKFSQQIEIFDAKYCNMIGLFDNKLTTKGIKCENRIENAAENLQTLYAHSNFLCTKILPRIQKTALLPLK